MPSSGIPSFRCRSISRRCNCAIRGSRKSCCGCCSKAASRRTRLDIEITESCLHENIGVVRSVVTSLKNQGIQISLDDFGTGYSSLAQLRSLPFDRLKIDRSFVTELAEEGANSKIVEAIVSLGRGFDLPITAEGIENGEVLNILRKTRASSRARAISTAARRMPARRSIGWRSRICSLPLTSLIGPARHPAISFLRPPASRTSARPTELSGPAGPSHHCGLPLQRLDAPGNAHSLRQDAWPRQ